MFLDELFGWRFDDVVVLFALQALYRLVEIFDFFTFIAFDCLVYLRLRHFQHRELRGCGSSFVLLILNKLDDIGESRHLGLHWSQFVSRIRYRPGERIVASTGRELELGGGGVAPF